MSFVYFIGTVKTRHIEHFILNSFFALKKRLIFIIGYVYTYKVKQKFHDINFKTLTKEKGIFIRVFTVKLKIYIRFNL